MWRKNIDALIEAALKEDMPAGDITSENIIPSDSISRAFIVAKEEGVLAGIYVAERVMKKIDRTVFFGIQKKDGEKLKRGDKIAALEGPSVSLLKGERTALNFLQRMSGIATITHKFVQVLEGKKTQVLDTRKTTPGLRNLEKYAVRMGGGMNHRSSLSDMVMIKDNHIKIVGSISEAVCAAKKKTKPGIKIEVETTDREEAEEALNSGADIVMLDNMPLSGMREVMKMLGGKVLVEVSGNIRLSNASKIADLGVDFISVGALTHSYKSLDISMEFID
ncbi:MAG: carboxylating nicotinate-nucleotide diphosphorylase [Candidatus Aminicenantes bacterium]|nr:MAG: carboxylating nicotinate-nucleotide diphosphorylase [Candidatus Aminicenantes bacterium]